LLSGQSHVVKTVALSIPFLNLRESYSSFLQNYTPNSTQLLLGGNVFDAFCALQKLSARLLKNRKITDNYLENIFTQPL
jgi:hypothetical protein